MKKIFSFILFLIIGINVFGYSGVLSGEKDLQIVKTKWFDIIYPKSCEKSAALLYNNADRIFDEVTAQYGLKPDFSMPVVITPGVDSVNAFFTSFPYNRIVLYDTSAQYADELSTVFGETFLSIFRHELTHAVTFNIKNGFWSGVTKFFGDVFLPGAFFVTSGMAEGAAVASESASGEGRLNNEFAKHIVKQAKIEGKFPNYFDVQGSADSLLPGIQYYFNGAFHQWLQKNYGMEKYANFWYRVINLSRLGVSWSFRKVYGISIRKAWKEFKESYEVPDIDANPVLAKKVSDFFGNSSNSSNDGYSIENKGGFRYFSPAISDKGLIYSDLYSNKVFFIEKDSLDNKDRVKPEILFSQKGMETVTTSKDGRFITVSYFANNENNITAKIKIYDTEEKCFYNVNEKGIKNGVIVSDGEDYYLLCHKFTSPYNSILVKKVIFSERNKISGMENMASIEQPLNVFCSNFIDFGAGHFSYIKKDGLDFSICVASICGADKTVNIKKEYKMPDNVVIHDISENCGNIYFSWAKKGTMPRFGYISQDEDLLFFSNEDISGGIHNPVVLGGEDGGFTNQKIIYIGKFYKENRILTFNTESEIFNNGEVVRNKQNSDEAGISIAESENHEEYIPELVLSSAEKYISINNLNKGLFVPISIYSSDKNSGDFGNFAGFLPFGITYVTSNPWSGGNDDLFLFTGGWGFLTNSIGFEVILNNSLGTSLFSYLVDLKTEFDRKGWRQSSGALNLSSRFNFGKYSTFLVENNFNITGGRFTKKAEDINGLFEKYRAGEKDYSINIFNATSLGYSNIHKTGPGRFEKGGVTTSTGLAYMYDSSIGDVLLATANISGYVPKLLPIIPKDDFVYNFPLKFSLSIFPVSSDYGFTNASLRNAGYSVLDSNIETVLFGMDIQRAIPYVDILFIQDFYLTLGYSSTVASYIGTKTGFQLPYIAEYFSNLGNGKSLYLDSIYLEFVMDISANIGMLANSMMQIGLFGRVVYPFNVINENIKNVEVTFGFDAKF